MTSSEPKAPVRSRTREVLLLGAAALVTLGAVAWSWQVLFQLPESLILDEAGHTKQILKFFRGELGIFRWPGEDYAANAMIPGFHAILAAMARMMSSVEPSLWTMREQCFVLSWVCPLLAFFIARKLAKDSPEPAGEGQDVAARKDLDGEQICRSALRAAQVYFLPFAYVYHFLVYTDITALIFALAAWLACLYRRPLVCAVLCLAAMLVRQTNVVFVAFLMGYSYIECFGLVFSRVQILEHLRRWWGLVVCMGLFVVFVLVNRRVGLDNPWQHPNTVSLQNIRFSLVSCSVLFLPWFLVESRRLPAWFRERPLTPCLVIAIGFVLAFLDSPLHPWNLYRPGAVGTARPDSVELLPSLWRNIVVTWFASSILARTVVAVGTCFTLLIMGRTKLATSGAAVLYPYWILVLLPVWLVEPRYHILPLTLFTLLRTPTSLAGEFALFLWFVALSMVEMRLIGTMHMIP
jgi:hypothetical protein